MGQRFGPLVDAILMREAILPDADSRHQLIEETSRAMTEASLKLLRNAGGDYHPDLAAGRFPPWQPNKTKTDSGNLTLASLMERWEMHPENETVARRTKATYRSVFRAVSSFLDDPKATEVSVANLDRYFEARMTATDKTRLKPRVARDVHKAALASVYGWALRKRLVPANPATDIRIKVKKPPTLRSKAASDVEARTFADAAIAITVAASSPAMAAAQRWCPLLLLYTGTRIGELTQLRRNDLLDARNGYPMLRLTPEAGDIKDGEFRHVPIHSRLVELGFLDFVEAAEDGPLFYRLGSRRWKDATTPQSELVAGKVADFGRAFGLHDPRLKRPLHSLRHRFMTLARRASIEEQYVEAIAGHSPGTQNRKYGDFPADVLHREIQKLDAQVVEGRDEAVR
jgi:integrase